MYSRHYNCKHVVEVVDLIYECKDFAHIHKKLFLFITLPPPVTQYECICICTCTIIGVRFSMMNNQGKKTYQVHIFRKKLGSELFKYVILEEQSGIALLKIIDSN